MELDLDCVVFIPVCEDTDSDKKYREIKCDRWFEMKIKSVHTSYI